MIFALLLQLAAITATVDASADAGVNVTVQPTNGCTATVASFTLEPGHHWGAPVQATGDEGQTCTYNLTATPGRNGCTATGGGSNVTAGQIVGFSVQCPDLTRDPIPPAPAFTPTPEPTSTPEPTPWPTPTPSPTSQPTPPPAPPAAPQPSATPTPTLTPDAPITESTANNATENSDSTTGTASSDTRPRPGTPGVAGALPTQTVSCHGWECELWTA